MQLDLFIAPADRAIQAPPSKPAPQRAAAGAGIGQLTPAAAQLPVAEMLHQGSKVEFPKNSNAIRVTIGNKTIVILKADADTLKGVGVATKVEFGTVRNDAKGHPIRKDFEVWVAPPPATADNGGELFG